MSAQTSGKESAEVFSLDEIRLSQSMATGERLLRQLTTALRPVIADPDLPHEVGDDLLRAVAKLACMKAGKAMPERET